MKAKKILFITQEMVPYVPESQLAIAGRELPQSIQERGFEIRTFMPRWGNINERRNQLHEVIRLSGMNIIIDDTDHTLVIKVASIQAAKMQVYFIDNDDFFQNRGMRCNEDGEEYTDNAERAIFYARGVLETIKKLRWVPDVIHCQGWISAVAPLYIKTAFAGDPAFEGTKVVFSAHDEALTIAPREQIEACLALRELSPESLAQTGIDFTQPNALQHLAVYYADGFIAAGTTPTALSTIAEARGIPTLTAVADKTQAETYAMFYQQLFSDTEM